MTAPSSIDPARFLHEQLASASPDLLRSMLSTFINTLMSAEADVVCGAPYGESSPQRVNSRNGYRHRDFDTRAGTVDVEIPKLREGSYFPDWLLQRRRRAERALTTVVATCYLLGVSTRRMEKLVVSLGITSLSKSQVSVMAAELDTQVADFRTRPLDAGPYTFVAADALVLKVREGGRVVNVHALVATGVNGDGHREILGLQVSSAEDGAGWLAFFRDLTARGLTGVRLVTSDAHRGLVAAIGATLPGASWQRCRTHWTCKEITCCFRVRRRMMCYAHRRRRTRSVARQLVGPELRKRALQVVDLRRIVDPDVRIVRVLLGVILVVSLRGIERLERRHLRDDRPLERVCLRQLVDVRLRNALLLVRRVEQRRPILRADVGALAVECRRVVVGPEDVEQLLVGDAVGVVLDLDDLGVAGAVGADVLVGGVGEGAAHVADRG